MKTELSKPFANFEHLMPSLKTLRFRLIPVGKTSEFLRKRNIIEKDRERNNLYPWLKDLADDFYRQFLHDTLSDFRVDWEPLQEVLLQGKEINGDQDKRSIAEKIANEQSHYRDLLMKRVSGQVDSLGEPLPRPEASTNMQKFKQCFQAPFVKVFLPDFLEKKKSDKNDSLSDEQYESYRAALIMYKKFTSRLTNFWESRHNIFTTEAIATSVTFRIVHELFPVFLSNCKCYRQNQGFFADELQILETELKEKRLLEERETLDQLFDISSFNRLLTQQGVDLYNAIIGGFYIDDREKVQGFNELVNLRNQQLKREKTERTVSLSGKMTRFRKQILARSDSVSFLLDQVENDADLFHRLHMFNDLLMEKDVDGRSIIDALNELPNTLEETDPKMIWVNAKNLNKLSHLATSSWNSLRDGLYAMAEEPANRKNDRFKRYVDASTEERDLSRLKNEIYFNLFELQTALNYTEIGEADGLPSANLLSPFIHVETDLGDELCELFRPIEELLHQDSKLQGNPDAISTIKRYLDAVFSQYAVWVLLDCENNDLRESNFYPEYSRVIEGLGHIVELYNLTRNYLSQKPDQKKKFKINFENPTLADGWSESKVKDNLCIMLRKNGQYYLGIIHDRNAYNILTGGQLTGNHAPDTTPYERMIYNFYPNAYRMIPKCSTALKKVKEHFIDNNRTTDFMLNPDSSSFHEPFSISREIFSLQTDTVNDKKKYQLEYLRKTEDEAGYKSALVAWIDFCKRFLSSYQGTRMFDYSHLKRSDQYDDIHQFYADVDRTSYHISFEKVPTSLIDEMVENGTLYLFQLYNRDFSPRSTGKPNLHTLYWRALFSEENLKLQHIKLDGQAELFFRPHQIDSPLSHEKGSFLLNKSDKNGHPLPADLYNEVYDHINKIDRGKPLSEEALTGMKEERFVYREAPYALVKNRRYTEDQLFFHVPIRFNWSESDNHNINALVNEHITTADQMHIIGIDRGERHLLYYSVINLKGEIVEQGSWNTLTQKLINDRGEISRDVSYHDILQQREEDRAVARKNWQSIDRIKDLKEGYLSHVIHALSKLIIQYHAIVVLENLNMGFKRGRFKVEKQVYQKFEVSLMNKLSALTFKSFEPTELGGILRPWQLTRRVAKLEEAERQNGIVFYVPAAYTSVVDPVTGFVNLFHFNKIKTKDLADFYRHFEGFRFDSSANRFVFRFNYEKMPNYCKAKEPPSREWDVISCERTVFHPKLRKMITVDTTEKLKKAFSDKGIDYAEENDLLTRMLHDKDLLASVHQAFKQMMQMRYTVNDIDAIASPALNHAGQNFDTRFLAADSALPENADANGAYNIARKGLLLVAKIKQGERSPIITNKEWFESIMNR